jgi:hypothetical protein
MPRLITAVCVAVLAAVPAMVTATTAIGQTHV